MKNSITTFIALALSTFISYLSAHPLYIEESILNPVANDHLSSSQNSYDMVSHEICEDTHNNAEVKIHPIEQLTEIENLLTSKMDAMGAIRFAEKFLQATYDYDFATMKSMISPLPEVQSFFTEDLYAYALKANKREGMKLNASKGIFSKCTSIRDLDLSTFRMDDIPGYYKANVYFDAYPKTDEAEFVSLRVMILQNIEDGTFSVFSIK